MLNLKNWILLPLLSAGSVLILSVCTGHAALLKDIRVGEYRGFTRVVFELDAPTEPEKIDPRSARRLAVVFNNTTSDLIRKIPVERSHHVDNIQIWEKGNRLTALLEFDFNGFDHKSFTLTHPPRFVLDIHPAPYAPDDRADSSPDLSLDSESESSQPPSADISEPAPQSDAQTASEKSAFQTPEAPHGEPHNPPTSVARDPSPAIPQTSAAQPSDVRPGRLQFYLVIVLVAITIVILALLLLMLLIRHRWIDDKSHLVTNEDQKRPPKTLGSQ